MQTFVPYDSILKSLACLDDKRLGKQRVEAKQILKALDEGGGWANHPATLMWRGYEDCLRYYHNGCIIEWVARGKRNTMMLLDHPDDFEMPWWWYGEIHASHRANLLRKDPDHYGQFGWTEDPQTPYFWPVKKEDFNV